MELTQAYLKTILHYNPDTGDFTRLARIGNGSGKFGEIAGHLQHGYRAIQIDGKKYTAHRLAFLYMDGSFPEKQVDHINGIREDNRYINLRQVTHAENTRNAKRHRTNTSGVTGISWHVLNKKWQAYIKVRSKDKYLGIFEDFFEAICARKSAEVLYGFHKNHGRKQRTYTR